MKLVLLLLSLVCLTRPARSQDRQNDQALISSFQQFGPKIFKVIATGTDNNFFLSSLAWYESAALVYNGARGETANNIAKGFGFQDVESTNAAFADILRDFRDFQNGTRAYAQVVRKLFVADKYQVNDKFKKVAKEIYLADVYNINFKDTGAATSIINQYFSEDSRDVLQDVLRWDSISSTDTLVSLQGVFKQGKWDVPFDPSLTATAQFSLSESEQVPVEMMTIQSAELDYYEDAELGVKYVALPFQDSTAELIILLPTKVDGLKDIVAHLEKTAKPPLKKTKVRVKLPKFQLLSRWDVKSLAKAVQVDKPSSKDADLSGIAGKPKDVTDDVALQLAYIRVNEAGILVPSGKYQGGSQKDDEGVQEVIVDHPFAFHIARLGVITSAARVTNPAEPVDEGNILELPSGKPKEE